MSNLVQTFQLNALWDYVHSGLVYLHPYIGRPLFLGAALFTGIAAAVCAALEVHEEKLAFCFLSLAFIICGATNLLEVQAATTTTGYLVGLLQATTGYAGTALRKLDLHMSGVSTALVVAFAFAFVFKLKPAIPKNARDLLPYISMGALSPFMNILNKFNETADGLSSMICLLLATGFLMVWAKRYGVFAMICMALCCVPYALLNDVFYSSDVATQDAMRICEAAIGLMLLMPLVFGPKGPSGEPSTELSSKTSPLAQPDTQMA